MSQNIISSVIDGIFSIISASTVLIYIVFLAFLVPIMLSSVWAGNKVYNELDASGYNFNVMHYAVSNNTGCRQIFSSDDREISRFKVLKTAQCYESGTDARKVFDNSIKYSRGFNFNNAIMPYLLLTVMTGVVLAIAVSGSLTEIGRSGAKKVALAMWLSIALILYIIVFGNYSSCGYDKEAGTAACPLYYNKTEQTFINVPMTYMGKLQFLDRSHNRNPVYNIDK